MLNLMHLGGGGILEAKYLRLILTHQKKNNNCVKDHIGKASNQILFLTHIFLNLITKVCLGQKMLMEPNNFSEPNILFKF